MALLERFLDFQFNLNASASANPNNLVQTTATKQALASRPSSFADGSTQVYLKGLRASANVNKAGGLSMGNASLAIYGMDLSSMNTLSTLGINPLFIGPNFVTVLAYATGGLPSVVFQGSITNAWMDGNSMPRVAFRVEAHAGLYEAIAPCPPSSYKGPVAIADVFSSLASQMGLSFENGGVKTILPAGTYFYGSARNQAYACAGKAGVNIVIDSGKLAVWPKGSAREGSVPLISPATGMKGYPAYTSKGVEVTTLFNPNIGYGANVQIESSLKPACGTWNVYGLDHSLESQTPGGSWFSTVRAAPLGSVVTSPGVTALPG